MKKFSDGELNRYSRIIALPEIGLRGQSLISEGKILVVGCGALGNVAATYLAAAGIGNLTIADFDTVQISNLHRQVMFATAEEGKPKSQALAERINALNPEVKKSQLNCKITAKEASEIFPNFDFIIDASDNASTKFMTSRWAEKIKIPCCIGGVSGFSGQITTYLPGTTPYHHIFTEPQFETEKGTSTPLPGVFGPTPGVVGTILASEALKFLSKSGTLLTNKLLTFDLLTLDFKILSL